MAPDLIYSTPFLFASFAIAIIGLFTLPRLNVRGAWTLVMLCFAAAVWTATEGMLYLGLDVETNMRITYVQYLGIAPVVPLALIFSLSVFGFERWINPVTVSLLAAMAIAVILLVWTNPLHHQVFSSHFRIDDGPVPMLGLEHGPVWWVIIGYHYALTALMSALLLRTVMISGGERRSQAMVVLVPAGAVWVANVVYVTGSSPVPNMDLGPLAFILVALSLAWGFFKYNLLDLLPIAKAEIFMAMGDPILVIDRGNRMLGINPAAERLFGLEASDAVGGDLDLLSAKHPRLQAVMAPRDGGKISLGEGDERHHFDRRTYLLKNKHGEAIGRVEMFHDISERLRATQAVSENRRLQEMLEMAGDVCHDLSQPVMAVMGYSDILRKSIDADDPLYPKALKLSEQLKRLKDTTHKLRRITRNEAG
jgi:PAS domain S-box-containing protein